MEIKGVAVKSIQSFVEEKHPDKYKDWLNSLSEKSKYIMSGRIIDGAWYSMKDAAVEPTERICDLFFYGSDKGAREAGRLSAERGLKGIYSLFIRILSPQFLISRASRVMTTYYRPSDVNSGEVYHCEGYMHIVKFGEPNHIIELRIGGWIERALELCGCKNVKVKITKSLTKGDNLTEYKGSWD